MSEITITKTIRLAALLLSLLVAMPVTTTAALSATLSPQPVLLAQNGITLDQAVNKVRAQTGGRILSAKKVNSAHPVYVIKVLLQTGQVKVFRVSALTGEFK